MAKGAGRRDALPGAVSATGWAAKATGKNDDDGVVLVAVGVAAWHYCRATGVGALNRS